MEFFKKCGDLSDAISKFLSTLRYRQSQTTALFLTAKIKELFQIIS